MHQQNKKQNLSLPRLKRREIHELCHSAIKNSLGCLLKACYLLRSKNTAYFFDLCHVCHTSKWEEVQIEDTLCLVYYAYLFYVFLWNAAKLPQLIGGYFHFYEMFFVGINLISYLLVFTPSSRSLITWKENKKGKKDRNNLIESNLI